MRALISYFPDDLAENAPADKMEAWLYFASAAFSIYDANVAGQNNPELAKKLGQEVLVFCFEMAKNLKIKTTMITRLERIMDLPASIAISRLEDFYAEEKVRKIGEDYQKKIQTDNHETERGEIIQISNRGVVEIHNSLTTLRNSVSGSTLDKERQIELQQLLNEFERLVNAKKANKGNLLTRLALIAAAIGGTTAFFADAPEAMKAVGQLTSVVGEEVKSAEEAKQITSDISAKFLTAPEEKK